MHAGKTMEIGRLPQERWRARTETDKAIFTPRLWKIMLLCMIPFFMIAAQWFEVLERSGTVWQYLAAPLLMTATVAYVACCLVLKKRNL